MTTPMSSRTVLNGASIPSIRPGKGDGVRDDSRSSDVTAAANAVLKPSIPMPSTSTKIRGVDFNDYTQPITVQQLTRHFSQTGFQASNLGRAIEIVNNMVRPLIQNGADCSDDGNLEIYPLIRTMKTKNFLHQMQNVLYF
jgi:hypothetical protein